jgi:hypothetical protein
MKLEVWISTLAPLDALIAHTYKLHVPRRDIEESSGIEISIDHHSSTYPISGLALKNASVDLDICTA